jgi:F-box domain
MILSQLPVDIVLEILDYLPLRTLIAALPLLSKSWAGFMKVNESSIFHYAAIRYGFSSSVNDSLESIKARSFIQYETDSWRSWCNVLVQRDIHDLIDLYLGIRKFQIEKSWLGKASSVCKMRRSTFDVHRIKVDEWSRYTMVTYAEGGLSTTDLTNNRVLWSLSDVRPS